MKKIIIILALFLGVCVITNAGDVRIIDKINYVLDDVNSGKNYDFTINKAQLGKYLELKDSVQFENVYRTYGVFCEGMLKAESAKSEKERIGLIFSSIDYTLRNMDTYLDKKQYKRFLGKFNKDMYNKGFFEESYLYCQKKLK